MTKSVREALMYVAEHPVQTSEPIDTPTWELMGRILFRIANSPDAKVRGSLVRATKAQRMISDRLVGTRQAGTKPAVNTKKGLEIRDLTSGALTP